MTGRRLWSAAAVLLALAAIVLAIVFAAAHFPARLSVLVCLVLAVCAAWFGVCRRGGARAVGIGAAALLLAGAIALVIVEGRLVENLLVLATVIASLAAARMAFRVHVTLPGAKRPTHPVLFYNPLSGGGKAERFHLADEARRRGIEPIELRRGDDLEELVRGAVVGPQAEQSDRRWEGLGGSESAVAILVSNNAYRLGRALGSGTRPRLDRGALGVTTCALHSEPADAGSEVPR